MRLRNSREGRKPLHSGFQIVWRRALSLLNPLAFFIAFRRTPVAVLPAVGMVAHALLNRRSGEKKKR